MAFVAEFSSKWIGSETDWLIMILVRNQVGSEPDWPGIRLVQNHIGLYSGRFGIR